MSLGEEGTKLRVEGTSLGFHTASSKILIPSSTAGLSAWETGKQHPSTSLQTVSWISFSNFISFSGNSGETDLWKPGPVLLDSGKYPFGLSSPSRRRCPALENEDGLTVQLVAQAAWLFKSFLLGPSGPSLGPFRLSKGCAGRYWFFKRERGNRKAKAGRNEFPVRWA